jgi:hypothetical protein
MDGMRLGMPADFAEVMERVVCGFRERNPGHPRFEDLCPDTVQPETMGQWRLAIAEGQIAAGIQLVPRAFVVAGNVRLPGMGLANVFCYPPFRKRGLMGKLLEGCTADMTAEGLGICLLGGDRTRYGNYGWEYAGAERALTLAAGVTRFEQAQPVSGVSLRTWNGDPGDLLRILEAYSRLPYRTERTAVECGRVLRRPGQVVWICDQPDTGFGYLSVRSGAIVEYGGARAAVERLVCFLLQSSSWSVALPPVDAETDLEKLLLHHAQSYHVRPAGMIRVISLRTVLEAYRPVLSDRLQAWSGDFALRAADTGETVRVTGDAGTLRIEGVGRESPALELPRRELAQLLFGPFAPDLGDWARHSAIRRLLPLPFYCHALAHV